MRVRCCSSPPSPCCQKFLLIHGAITALMLRSIGEILIRRYLYVQSVYVFKQFSVRIAGVYLNSLITDILVSLQIICISSTHITTCLGKLQIANSAASLKELSILSYFCHVQNNLKFEAGKPENNSAVRYKNTKQIIINHKETGMVKNGELINTEY